MLVRIVLFSILGLLVACGSAAPSAPPNNVARAQPVDLPATSEQPQPSETQAAPPPEWCIAPDALDVWARVPPEAPVGVTDPIAAPATVNRRPNPDTEFVVRDLTDEERAREDSHLRIIQSSSSTEADRRSSRYAIARLYYQANQVDVAAPLFMAIARDVPAGELRAYSAQLALDSLNARFTHQLNDPATQTECIQLLETWAEESRGQLCSVSSTNQELCEMLSRLLSQARAHQHTP
ncbi:MAG: hypothetical protein IPK60_15870 [Sandaracinaceae bacterium]|nr:hypothetical protein [Sandaracinaceae bacterium]